MKFFIDFEATQANEIISIGAVSEIGTTFKSLVKPQLSSISPYISQLTHITEKMLSNAKCLDEVFNEMYYWITRQCPDLMAWEFLSYGDDEKFVKASLPNIHTCQSMILAAMLIATMRDGYKDIKEFFKGSISLINAFNYVENLEKKQRHDPLEDALMFQKVYEHIQTNEPPVNSPAHEIQGRATDCKMPSGTFYCHADGKNAKVHKFENIDAAIDWYIENHICKEQRPGVHRERIMKNIMVSVRKHSKYAGYHWKRIKEEEKEC